MSKTIMIVEDDKALSKMWSDLLQAEGFDIVTERDGEWAIKTFRSRKIDFLIIDVLIPIRSGFHVVKKLRSIPEGMDVPIVLVSGIYRASQHSDEAINQHGVLAYLDKPVKNEELVDILKKHFGTAYPSVKDSGARKSPRKSSDPLISDESLKEVEEVEASSRVDFVGLKVNRGNLRSQPFPEVLAELYRWRVTGALLLKKGKVKKIVYFKDGYPIFVKSNILAECLGKVMLREKIINKEQCEKSVELMRASGRQQGTVLIEQGLISPHNLVYALELQLKTKLIEPFGWEWGEYQFTRSSKAPITTVNLDITTAALIREGVKEKWSLERVLSALGSVEEHFVVPASEPLYRYQEMDMEYEEQVFFRRINGKRTVSDLLEKTSLDHENAYQILYALKCAQMVEIRPEKVKRREMVTGVTPPKLPPKPPAKPPPMKSGKGAGKNKSLLPEVAAFSRKRDLPWSETEKDLKKKFLDDLQRMQKQNYFEILGVARSAGNTEIRKAYFNMAREYHPDKIAGAMSDDVRELARKIYDIGTKAHDVLADPTSKTAYIEQLGAGARKKDVGDEVSKILAAEGKFQRGEALMRKGNLDHAAQAFIEAIDLYPNEGEFHAYLGWTIYQLNPNDPRAVEVAMNHIMRAIELNPRLDKAYLFLGYIHKGTGRSDKAEKQFEKAIQCNPDCTEAIYELRLAFHSKGWAPA